MKIGLIDVDGHNFPNLPLMKLSAWHKRNGDDVDWYYPLISGHVDKVYMSKVFSFSPDYEYYIDADEVVKGGSGYCIQLIDGKEVYNAEKETSLPYETEHIFPDYSLYEEQTKDTAYGFLTRGCPRGCGFCHVANKEGKRSYKTANLSEFWNGQKNIVLLDPNITACTEWEDLFCQLIESKAYVDFSQGLDARLLTARKCEMLKEMKIKRVHFALDRYEDMEKIIPKLEMLKELTGWDKRIATVYILTNYDTTIEQDLERITRVRQAGFSPYVMIYNKTALRNGDEHKKIQRWVNNRILFDACPNYEDYKPEYRRRVC